MNATHGTERKVVLLTGASGRVGTAFCQRFATTYDIVAVRHRRPIRVASQHQYFVDPFAPEEPEVGEPGAVLEVMADLRHEAEIARVVEVALARFGRIDAVVNAIGAFDARSQLLNASLTRGPELFQLNALVPIAVATRVTLDFWRHHDRENGSHNRVVINLSAAAGLDASDGDSGSMFGATKAALNMLTFRLSDELRPFNVRVVAVAPATLQKVVSIDRVVTAIGTLLEGDASGQMLLLWRDREEMV
jgi:NAD(P)-dependent dehydrogenase (short-subunit alcohol dehydrogenase family)